MKKLVFSIAIILLTLASLTACSQDAPEPTAAATIPFTTEAPTVPVTTAPTVQLPDRPETMDMEFFLEGMPVTVPASLFVGQNYSMYITDQEDLPGAEWILTQDGHTDTWTFEYNPATQMAVSYYPGQSAEEVRSLLMAQESDYALGQDKQGGLLGKSSQGYLDIRIHELADGCFALSSRYPTEAAEGSGVRMSVMMSTFEPTQEDAS